MTESTPHIEGHTGAKFSRDENHRFALWRRWDFHKPMVLFIGLNPSRGHAFYNDHTIRRCISFAKAWDHGGMMFSNLYTLKSPRPALVKADPDAACHPDNNYWLSYMMDLAGKVVFCWGSWDFIESRQQTVIAITRATGKQPFCFGLTKDGFPKHPARLSNSTQLSIFQTKTPNNVMKSLTKENFWNELKIICPLAVHHFCKWIDEYKRNVGWEHLFNGGIRKHSYMKTPQYKFTVSPKFHDLPLPMQVGIIIHYFQSTLKTYTVDIVGDDWTSVITHGFIKINSDLIRRG